MKNELNTKEKELRRKIRKQIVKEFYSNTNQLDGVDDNAIFAETNRRFAEERKKIKPNL